MPRSSRHKSHKEAKNSSRDIREKSESEEDVKMKSRNGKEEGSVRVSRDSGSSEKRKLSSSRVSSGYSNGDASEDYVGSKRRKEKADVNTASDRWNGGEDEVCDVVTVEKEIKVEISKIEPVKTPKSKALVDLKSKSSRRSDSGSEKKSEDVDLVAEKDDSNRSSSRVELKRKSEKDSARKEVHDYKDSNDSRDKDLKDSVWKEVHDYKDSNDSRDKERSTDRERKTQASKYEAEAGAVEGEVGRKQGSNLGEERRGKRSRENTELAAQGELQDPELEKELGKRTRRRRDESDDRDKDDKDKERCQDDVKEREDNRLSSRGERTKDERYKDMKHGEKHREDVDKDTSRDYKYREDSERYGRHRDVKYREARDKNIKPKDKYQENGERDDKYRDDVYREDDDRVNRYRADKHYEDGEKAYRHRGDRYREDGDRRDRRRDDGDEDDRRRGDQYLEDGKRDGRNKEEKKWEEVGRDGRHRDEKQRNDMDKDRRLQDAKYRDERSSRDLTSDKPDIKGLRDENTAAEPHYRKSNNRDASPNYDDRRARYKDEIGRRRIGDKEDDSDMRLRSTKEQHADAAKFIMSSARAESVSDRGRSRALNADIENPSRRRSSPGAGSHFVKDQYRNVKLEESKNRDYASEERHRHYTTSRIDYSGSTRSNEKSFRKDDSHLHELPERRSKADSRRSPSSERRLLNRSDGKRGLDIENSGQRDGGSKDYSSREGKGGREFLMETHPGDDYYQEAGDNLSVSSPFSKPAHLSGNSRSFLLAAPPLRMGAENTSTFGSFEEDHRGKSNNRYRRNSDPNMGRLPGNAWRGVPNWNSPVANGFLPFQHGPPPVGFHPMMQPFPTPPLFGVRPPMELNPPGFPYHVNDGDRYSSHGPPLGWHNPADDSCGPAIHGWDANSSGFRDESHNYGRLNWDHKRSLSGADSWMGQNNDGSMLQSSLQRDDHSSLRGADEPRTAQSDMKDQSDKKHLTGLDDNIGTNQLRDFRERNNLESPKTVPDEPDLLRKDYTCPSHVYLSMLDISEDLTEPELFSQFTSLMGMDQKIGLEDDDSKLFFVEEFIDPALKNSHATSSASLFPAINDSIGQKAMSLYKKLRGEIRIGRDEVPFSKGKNVEALQILGEDGVGSRDDEPMETPVACDQTEVEEGDVLVSNAVKMEISPIISSEKIDEPVEASNTEKSESLTAVLREVKMELDTEMNVESSDRTAVDKSSYPEISEKSTVLLPGNVGARELKFEDCVLDEAEHKLNGAKFGSLLLSGVSSSSSMGCEAVMPELIEPGSVNLSRIHQSPESTH